MQHRHASYPAILKPLKGPQGHLASIGIIEEGQPRTELSRRFHTVESVTLGATRRLIHDPIEHCLGNGGRRGWHQVRSGGRGVRTARKMS